MLFTSPTFLFIFLPAIVLLYALAPIVVRNTLLVIASVFFYTWGEARFLPLLLASMLLNYVGGCCLGMAQSTSLRRGCLTLGIVANLALLFHFKYSDFLFEQINTVLMWAGKDAQPLSATALPLGISFFTFHAISYLVDIYRGTAKAQYNPLRLALYMLFFPQLIAGPIVRYHAIAAQLTRREFSRENFVAGTARFILGLAKKLIIANALGEVADQVFAVQNSALTSGIAWLGIVCYSLQIYFDFSGYSDMAIGLARVFGFHFPENFNYPYTATSVRDFWRRWHITLSAWFRDYLYLPLGGNRGGKWRTMVNLYSVFLLCGLWHGASWNFVVWGAIHGTMMVFERMFAATRLPPVMLRHVYVWLVVMCAWVVFRANDMEHAYAYLSAMAGNATGLNPDYALALLLDQKIMLILLISLVTMFPIYPGLRILVQDQYNRSFTVQCMVLCGFWLPLVVACLSVVASDTHNPFIYFRF